MPETAICRDCENYVPVTNAAKGPDLDGTVVCQECWTDDDVAGSPASAPPRR